MKWLRTLVLFNRGDVISTRDWGQMHRGYLDAIQSIDYPRGSRALTLRRKTRRSDGQWNRNGVGYLKQRFLNYMQQSGWQTEAQLGLTTDRTPPELMLYPSMESYREPITSGFGNFDFVTTTSRGTKLAIEWETGNISSSHRTMNKLAIALATGVIEAGVLIVPSRDLYEHLTDRIGNIGELSGYLELWKDIGERVETGLLAISVVEHDELTDDPNLPYLTTGMDGRAQEARARYGAPSA